MNFEWRAVLAPDFGVFSGGLFWPGVEDDAVEYGPPEQFRQFDHARVGEEFLEVAAYRGCGRRIWRAEVEQQDCSFFSWLWFAGCFVEIPRHQEPA